MPKTPAQAVVLLSGGLDSSTCLYWAKGRGYRVTALCIDYGQRHGRELASARAVAQSAGVKLHQIKLSLPWLKASSLVNKAKNIPDTPFSRIGKSGIPSTYVPGRNTIFLALGLSLADTLGAQAVVAGANAVDFSGYPDCRPAFYRAFARVARAGTRLGSRGRPLEILAPLLRLDKAAIVRLAIRLKVPLRQTWSCYRGLKRPCGRCDSCKLRAKGFAAAKASDPAGS